MSSAGHLCFKGFSKLFTRAKCFIWTSPGLLFFLLCAQANSAAPGRAAATNTPSRLAPVIASGSGAPLVVPTPLLVNGPTEPAVAAEPRFQTLATESFDAASVGRLPAGWVIAQTGAGQPQWTVVADASAPSPRNVLKQSGVADYPLCVFTNVAIQDGFVAMQFKPLSGLKDQAGGLVWRYRDANNYYIARANALENNVVLYKVANGKRTPLDIVGRTGGYGANATVAREQWSRLRVEFAGSRHKVFFNGALLFEVEDRTFTQAGAVGLWTKADSVTLFDDFACGK